MAKEILFNEDARRALGRGVDALANAVIRGDYGVGEERRARLGANYDAVQNRVNQILLG